jgi:hypothetical protein
MQPGGWLFAQRWITEAAGAGSGRFHWNHRAITGLNLPPSLGGGFSVILAMLEQIWKRQNKLRAPWSYCGCCNGAADMSTQSQGSLLSCSVMRRCYRRAL